MKSLLVHTGLLMCLFLVSCASQSASAQKSKPQFVVNPSRAEDIITVFDEGTQTVFDIQSDFGIGSASFELASGSMPDSVLLRLHLQGLEEFQLSSTAHTLKASVASEGGFPVSEERGSLFGNQAIGSSDALWMDIHMVTEIQQIPLEAGYFEVRIPQEFLRKAGNSFEVKWIDFYR